MQLLGAVSMPGRWEKRACSMAAVSGWAGRGSWRLQREQQALLCKCQEGKRVRLQLLPARQRAHQHLKSACGEQTITSAAGRHGMWDVRLWMAETAMCQHLHTSGAVDATLACCADCKVGTVPFRSRGVPHPHYGAHRAPLLVQRSGCPAAL